MDLKWQKWTTQSFNPRGVSGDIHRLATLVECSLKFPSASHLICIINGLLGRRKKGRGMGKGKKCKSEEKGRELQL